MKISCFLSLFAQNYKENTVMDHVWTDTFQAPPAGFFGVCH